MKKSNALVIIRHASSDKNYAEAKQIIKDVAGFDCHTCATSPWIIFWMYPIAGVDQKSFDCTELDNALAHLDVYVDEVDQRNVPKELRYRGRLFSLKIISQEPIGYCSYRYDNGCPCIERVHEIRETRCCEHRLKFVCK